MRIIQSKEAPWFCHKLDCPSFEVTSDGIPDGIEFRTYAPGVWVSTNVDKMGYDEAVGTGFMRLFSYISGANEDEAKVPMTAPVR